MTATGSQYRIAFVDHAVDIGGAEKSLTELAARLDQADFTPVLLHSQNAKWVTDEVWADASRLVVFRPTHLLEKKRQDLGSGMVRNVVDMLASCGPVFSVWRALVKVGADLVHTNSLKCHLVGGLAAKLSRRPLVWHMRDILAEDEGLGLLRRAAVTLRPHIIAISSAVAEQFSNLPVQVTHIPNGVPLELFTPGEPDLQLRAELGLDAADELLCMVGRLTPWKGHKTLLEAFSMVARNRPHAKLMIVGEVAFWENSYEGELKDLAVDLRVADRVIWTGYREDVSELLRLCDIFVLPSVNEPFGRVLIEAMATGKPVIGTNSGGVPEIIVDGETGLLVPSNSPTVLAEAIEEMLSDPLAARQMGQAGLRRARERFDAERVAQQVQQVYRRLLDRNWARRPAGDPRNN